MTSIYKLLAQNCGLTLEASAEFLGAPLETARSWWAGRRNCPDEQLSKLCRLQGVKLADAERARDELGEKKTIPQDEHVLRLLLYAMPEGRILQLQKRLASQKRK